MDGWCNVSTNQENHGAVICNKVVKTYLMEILLLLLLLIFLLFQLLLLTIIATTTISTTSGSSNSSSSCRKLNYILYYNTQRNKYTYSKNSTLNENIYIYIYL